MKNVCVYCGSRKPLDIEIRSLVYGGGKVGMMGLIADASLSNNGEVIGVIPTHLKRAEVAHTGLTKLHETQDMHTRKALMESLSDAFVVLPGGFGTLDEFFEILTWRQLGIHNKPIILVNINGYFDGLELFTKKAVSEDFIKEEGLELFQIAHSLEECIVVLMKCPT